MPEIANGDTDSNVCWLLLSDVPPGTVIGLDANVWTVGNNFRGIRDIPLGLHYFFFNASGNASRGKSVSGLRCSMFLDLIKPCVVKKRWIKETEDFIDLPSAENDVELIQSNKSEVALYLGAYPKDRFADWIALSSHITADVVNRLQPSGGRIYSCAQFQSKKSTSQDRAALPIPTRLRRDNENIVAPQSIASGEELLPVLKTLPETDLRWTELPQHPLYPPGSTSSEISQHNMDQTYTLNHIIAQLESQSEKVEDASSPLKLGEARLLGEFHFAFVIFLLGEVLEGWFHWRKLFSLLANCERAVLERPKLYKALITSLYRLLIYSDDGGIKSSIAPTGGVSVAGLFQAGGGKGASVYFDGWQECQDSEPAFLPHTMTRLFANIATATERAEAKRNHLVADVLDRAEGLRSCLERRFKVRLKTNCDSTADGEMMVNEVDWDTDEAPVIVPE